MFSNVVEVQTDATAHAHFKYEWYMGGERKLSQLRKELRTRFRNSSLLTANSKYSLFEVRTNCNIEIAGYTDYTLQTGSKFALKTNDGHKFYAQAITNEDISNQLNQTKKLVTNVSKEQQKLMNNVSKEQTKLIENVSAQSRKQEAARRQEIKSLNTEMKNERAWLTQSHREQIKKMEQIKEDTITKCQEMNISTHANSINLMYNTIQTHKISFDERTESLKELNVKYQKYYTKLKTEYDRLQQFHHEEIKDPNIKQLVLLGITGDGKSTFGNRLCGDTSKKGKSAPFKASNSATSETTRIKKEIVDTDGARVAVVDTPGIFDTEDADYRNAIDLIEWLKGCGGINLFVVVFKPWRVDAKFQAMLVNLRDMLGTGFWKHVIFVVTHLKINMVCNKHQHGVIIDSNEGKDECEDNDDDKSPQEYLIDFKAKIKSILKLPVKPVVIGVESMNENSYHVAVEEILFKCKQKEKFKPKRLISPFDIDKAKLQKIYDKMKLQIAFRNQIKQAMFVYENIIIKQIKDIRKHNSEYKTSFNACALNVLQMTRTEKINFQDVSIIDRHKQNFDNEFDNKENFDNEFDDKEMSELNNSFHNNSFHNNSYSQLKEKTKIKPIHNQLKEFNEKENWNCLLCTYENKYQSEICVMCETGATVCNPNINAAIENELLEQTFVKLHSKSTKWIDDSERSECVNCGQTFSMLKWKYHCNACGDIFCWEDCTFVSCKPNPQLNPNFANKESQIQLCIHCAKKYKYYTYKSIN